MGLDANTVAAGAQVILAVGALATGGWAVHTYRQGKKAEVARWQKDIFDSLFLSGKFDDVRVALEVDYESGLGKNIELSIQDRDSQFGTKEHQILLQLDNFLNLIEYVLYLEQDKNLIDSNDRNALLGYWLDVIGDCKRSSLRYYISHFGYERIAKVIEARSDTFLILYGSLRKGQEKFKELKLRKYLEPRGNCIFEGMLYDLGDFPDAVPGRGKVVGEIYRVKDSSIFSTLDEYEEFDISRPDTSLFVRRCIHVDKVGDAWVYLYNGETKDRPLIASGDWRERNKSGASGHGVGA